MRSVFGVRRVGAKGAAIGGMAAPVVVASNLLQRNSLTVLLTHPPCLWWSEEHLPRLRICVPCAVPAQELVRPLAIAACRRHRADAAVGW